MDKELAVPKWVLIVRPKIPQMPQKMSAQKLEIFEKKLSLGFRVVRVCKDSSPWCMKSLNRVSRLRDSRT